VNAKVADRIKLLATGIAVAGAGIAYAIYGNDDVDPRWIGLAVNTFVLLGCMMHFNRKLWRVAKFWTVLGLLTVGCFTASLLILLRVSKFPLLWFVPVSVVEAFSFQSIIEKYCGV
jgi:hypothetical protein